MRRAGTQRNRLAGNRARLLAVLLSCVGMLFGGGVARTSATGTSAPLCVTSVTSAVTVPTYGGSATINVSAPTNCFWSVQSAPSYITVLNGSSRSGSGSFIIVVAANPIFDVRDGVVVVDARQTAVHQDALIPATFRVVSDADDPMGQGGTLQADAPSATFIPTLDLNHQHVQMRVLGSDGFNAYDWSLHLASPAGQVLSVGSYPIVARYPTTAPTVPGLYFVGAGRTCAFVTGRFDVLEVVLGPTTGVLRLRATFEQHCDGAAAALRGELTYGPLPFVDDPMLAGSSLIKSVHIVELRQRIDAQRIRQGLPAYTYSAPITPGASLVNASAIVELRTAVASVYSARGIAQPTYTDTILSAGMPIKRAHISELRAAVITLEWSL